MPARQLCQLALLLNSILFIASCSLLSCFVLAQNTVPTRRLIHLKRGDNGYQERRKDIPGDFPLPIPPEAKPSLIENTFGAKGRIGYYLRLEDKQEVPVMFDWYLSSLKSSPNWEVTIPPGQNILRAINNKTGVASVIQFHSKGMAKDKKNPRREVYAGTSIIMNVLMGR